MLPGPGYYRATLNFDGAGVASGACVVWCGGNGDDLTPLVIGQRIDSALTASGLMTLIPNTIRAASVLVKLGPDETGPSALAPVDIVGGSGGQGVDAGRSWLIHKATATGGRRGRGRMYWPGLSEANVNAAGAIDTAAVTAFQTEVTDFYGQLQAQNIDMYLEHGPKTEWELVNGQPRRKPIPGVIPDPDVVLGLTVESTTASQRRRVRR